MVALLMSNKIRMLSRTYAAKGGVPVLARVDARIFERRYFTNCLDCTYCNDWCCSFGVDIDLENVERLMKHADGIEAYIGIPRAEWLDGIHVDDPDYPGGGNQRTRTADGTVEGGCIFLDRGRWGGRGCMLHRYALETGIDYHEIKPLMSSLFPLSFEGGDGGCTLRAAGEVGDEELVCLDEGPTIYRGSRNELLYYFGDALVAELDALEASLPAAPVPEKKRLPIAK
jgi:Fe-S-cluster containining protein